MFLINMQNSPLKWTILKFSQHLESRNAKTKLMLTGRFEFFTIDLSDAFLSDYLTDLKLHSTK